MTTRSNYDHELSLLEQDLKHMGQLIEKALRRTILAFKTKDYELAQEIIRNDRNIDDMERAIESRCLALILRQQPVSGDLRTVSTALKAVTDLERIGDHASDIAELILQIHGEHEFEAVRHLPAMADTAAAMVHDAVAAFLTLDTEAAKEIMKRDDVVDQLFNDVKQDVIQLLKNSKEISDQSIDFLMIAKYLERIGDHAVNICEWTEFAKTGKLKNVRLI